MTRKLLSVAWCAVAPFYVVFIYRATLSLGLADFAAGILATFAPAAMSFAVLGAIWGK